MRNGELRRNTAIPKLEAWGYKVTVIHGEVTYLNSFNHLLVRGKSQGMKRGFPSFVGCSIQRDCKTRPLERYWKAQIGKNVEQYIGIAIDEPERLKRLEGTNGRAHNPKVGSSSLPSATNSEVFT